MNTSTRWLRASLVMALLVPALTTQARAQDSKTAEQLIETLRQQLRDVTEKQAQLQARVEQLDESLRPENIERSVAGIGTTDATALRDKRREQLEREKAVVEEQLRSLDASRARLEASIASAEAEAVRLRASALGASNAPPQENGASVSTPAASASPAKPNARRAAKRRKRARARRRASSH